MGIIYTIGTSIHTIDDFLLILEKYNINAVADVRSIPYSKHTPQYNRETKKKHRQSNKNFTIRLTILFILLVNL